MSTVSVIIPNYNRAQIIAETIDNMLSQTLEPVEVIVVDDGSTDSSVEVIKSFGDKVKIIQQTNKGPGAARNAGLKVARGEFIQFMDSDDLASLNKLEAQVKALESQKADIVYGPWAKVWINMNIIQLENVVLQQKQLPLSRSPLLWFLTDWSMVFQQCLVRKSKLDEIGGYREDMKCLEDGELFVRLLLSKAKLVFEDESLTFYRLDDYGKLTESGNQQWGRLLDQLNYYNGLFKLSRSCSVLNKYMEHPQVKLRIWEAVTEINNPEILRNYPEISGFQTNDFRYGIKRWLRIKRGGLRQRLKGHRWPKSFQAGPLINKQLKLIADLGWQVVGHYNTKK